MAQQFQVLRCCFCHTFQVQQVQRQYASAYCCWEATVRECWLSTCPIIIRKPKSFIWKLSIPVYQQILNEGSLECSPLIKKSKKWNCKMCGEKQSVLKVFGHGSGLDCRCHVQKLNLLQGEVEQASVNMLRYTEEPEEREDENTAIGLEENLGWQERRVGLTSRWTKYLDKKCDDPEKKEEEEMVLTEKQTYHSEGNTAKNPRKRTMTRLYPTDVQGPDQKRADGLAKNIRCFESRKTSATADTKNCGDHTCKSLIVPVTKEPLLHGKNEESASRGAPISKWEKFLLSDECANSGMTTPIQKSLETPVKTPSLPASDDIASFIDITPSNWGPEPKQYASILIDQVSNTEHVEITSKCTGRSRETPVLASSLNLFNRLSKEPASVPSLSPPAVSNVKNFYRSLFSTGEDFDDSL